MVKNVISGIGLGMLLVGTMNAQNPAKMLSSIQDLGFLRPQTLPLDRSLGTVNTTHWMDLNGDERLDLLIGASAGLFVRWGGASPSGLGDHVAVSICEGREVLEIHDSGCGSGLVWVECAETHRSMLLDFQPDGSCEPLHEIDGMRERLLGAGGGMFWLRPDEEGVIQAFVWDVNLSQAVSVSSIQAEPVMQSMLTGDFDGDG